MFNLRHVRSLVAVVDYGNFRAASRHLGCSQPAVSQHVRKIEEALGVLLIVRDRQQCRPTAEGEIFLPYARGLLRVAARAREAVKNRALSVGASSNIGIYLLPPYVKAFQEAGGTRVDLAIGANPSIADKLEAQEVDVAVMEWWDARPGFAATLWRREPLVVIVAPDHPWSALPAVPWAQLLDTPLIGGEPGSGTGRALRAAFGPAADKLRVSQALGSTEAVKHVVGAGLGVSVVLESAVRDEVRAGTLRALPLADAHVVKDFFVIHRAGQPDHAPAARFAAHLMAA